MDPFADPSDVEDIWRPLSDAETVLVASRIMQASRMVRREVPLVGGLTVDQRITAGTLTAGDVKDVVAEMVLRVMSIPQYVRQESVTVDDGSRSRTYDASVSGAGGMFITDKELRSLSGRRGTRQKAFTIYPGPGLSWT